MSKREDLENKIEKLEKEIKKDYTSINLISLQERSITVAKFIKNFGNLLLFISVIIAVYSFIWTETAILFRIVSCIIYIVVGYLIKMIFECLSLILFNLVELNNK